MPGAKYRVAQCVCFLRGAVKRIAGRNVNARCVLFLVLVFGGICAVELNPYNLRTGPGSSGRNTDFATGICFALFAVGSLLWIVSGAIARARTHVASSMMPPDPSPIDPRVTKASIAPFVCCIAFICLGWAALFHDRFQDPVLIIDDHHYVAIASSWELTYSELFVPTASHAQPIPKLYNWLVLSVAGGEAPARAFAWAGLLLYLPAWPMLYWFLQREFRSSLCALIGLAVFVVSRTHQEIVL